jgi:CRISPR type III-A-associated RAMP protein Csm5
MEVKIRTITPVHIGLGVDLQPYEYSLDNLEYKRYNLSKIFEKIYRYRPDLIDKWDEFVSRFEKEQNQRTGSREKSQSRLAFNIRTFLQQNNVDVQSIDKILKSKDSLLYSFVLLYPVDRSKTLKEQIKTSDRKALLPGSSIKGAIRSALVYKALKTFDSKLVQQLLNGVENSDIQGLKIKLKRAKADNKNYDNTKKTIADELEHLLFYAGYKEKNGAVKYSDEKFDVLKALLVSDTFNPVAEITVVAVNSYKKASNRNKTGKSFDEQPLSLFEVIDYDGKFDCRIDVDIKYLYYLYNERKDLLGLRECVQKAYGFDISEVNEANFEEYKNKAISYIKEAIREYSTEIIKKDVEWLKRFQPQEIIFLKRGIDKIDKLISENKILLRVGYGSGFHSTTALLGMVKNNNLKEFYQELMKTFKIGVPIKKQSNNKNDQINVNIDKFPSSRRLVCIKSQNASNIEPLGWVELIF